MNLIFCKPLLLNYKSKACRDKGHVITIIKIMAPNLVHTKVPKHLAEFNGTLQA